MRSLSRLLLAVGVVAATTLGPAVASHAAGSGSLTTSPSAEAWFRTTPVCGLPAGCPAQPPSPYAPDTLHIGVLLGEEESRTVLQLDLSGLPAGTKPTGGQLRLPVAAGPQDGTASPDSATLQACPVAAPVADADGSAQDPPAADCASASVPAVFVPATPDTAAAFTLDLLALAAAWESSPAPGALALLPSDETAPPQTWHVAVSNRRREGAGVEKITAAVSYASAAVDVVAEPPPFVAAPVDSSPSAPFTFTPSGEAFLPADGLDAAISLPTAAQAPVQGGPAPQAAPTQVVPVAMLVDGSFRYPAVFLLPLLIAAACGWAGRALTRDLSPA